MPSLPHCHGCVAEQLPVPSLPHCRGCSYRWDSSKVRELLEKKRAAGALPVNVAAEKSRLKRLLEESTASGSTEEAAM